MDPNRMNRHPTTLIDLDPHAIINAMLDCAPTEDGQRYVACAVISCQEHTNLLVDLANTWLRYFLLVFKGNSDARNDGEPSGQVTPTFQATAIQLESIRSSRKSSFRDNLLERDGYRCGLTGIYEISRIAPSVEGPKATLEAAHILKRAVAIFDNKQEKSVIATWDIIRQYAHWPETTLGSMLDLIDEPENGFLLQHDLHQGFEKLWWTLIPETTIPNTYRVKLFRGDAIPWPHNKVITFKNHEPPEGLLKVPSPKTHPLPNPSFLALHAALAQVLHMSGAGEVIDLYMDRLSKDRHGVPSDKIRHGDELALLMSQIQL
ncbi:hypothetical protein K439DRAFT_1659900 [Ramaria rubella]|nr:hypothetical protein K439DRAFT_1659900 [Ramaria rubella]